MITAFVEKDSIKGQIIEIRDKSELNHMKNSFRLKVLDELRVVDGEFEYRTEILEISKNEILCKILEKKEDNYYLVECNTRFGGASTLAYKMGLKSFYWFLCEENGIKFKYNKAKKNLRQIRVKQDIYLEN